MIFMIEAAQTVDFTGNTWVLELCDWLSRLHQASNSHVELGLIIQFNLIQSLWIMFKAIVGWWLEWSVTLIKSMEFIAHHGDPLKTKQYNGITKGLEHCSNDDFTSKTWGLEQEKWCWDSRMWNRTCETGGLADNLRDWMFNREGSSTTNPNRV